MRESRLRADYAWLYRETLNRLYLYRDRVKEGKDLDAAVFFARYVLWSKLSDILSEFDNAQTLVGEIDSAFLRGQAQDLERTVCRLYAGGKPAGSENYTQLEAIDRRLGLIAGQLVAMSETQQRQSSVLVRLEAAMEPTQDSKVIPLTRSSNG